MRHDGGTRTDRLEREAAIGVVLGHVPDDALVVCANGHIGREAQRARDRDGNFYMIGSMGLGASIALGAARVRPERLLVVLDGDGNVLMGLGTLASVAAAKPRRFLHLCFDNAEYGSTGGQRTISPVVPLEAVARAAGYARAERVRDRDSLARALDAALAAEGPSFVLVEVRGGEPADLAPRVKLEPPAIADRFRAAATKGGRK